jgi:hypothetical protein
MRWSRTSLEAVLDDCAEERFPVVKVVLDTAEAEHEQGDYAHLVERRILDAVVAEFRRLARRDVPEAYGDEDGGLAERMLATADMLEQVRVDWWGKDDASLPMTVWLVESGNGDDGYLAGAFGSLEAALEGIKEPFGHPYVVRWEEPSTDEDGVVVVRGHFERVPDYSTEHVATYLIREEPVR